MRIRAMSDLKNLLHFLRLLVLRNRKKSFEKVRSVRFITFRRFFPDGGAGGGGAVQSANRVLFGSELNGVSLKYSFYEDNRFSTDRKNELCDLFGAAEFVRLKTKDDRETAYITHDYGSAFGLYLAGKKYVLVSHIQGARVEEKINFGEKFTFVSRKIIQASEKLAFAHALCVCFPSEGAYDYFADSRYKVIRSGQFKKGRVLYNTLYAIGNMLPVSGITQDESCTTFLSVGQLTKAKGLDRNPLFLEAFLKKTAGKVRYIMVGKGPLEAAVKAELNRLSGLYDKFSYIHLKGCSYAEMQYLQNMADVYLMLHRISIFDLTTLEMMDKSKCVVLSDVGGNPEFNREDNIILVKNDDYEAGSSALLGSDIKMLGNKNKRVYEKYFSNRNFAESYGAVLEELLGD